MYVYDEDLTTTVIHGGLLHGSDSAPDTYQKGAWLEKGTYLIRIRSSWNSYGNFWVKASFKAAGNKMWIWRLFGQRFSMEVKQHLKTFRNRNICRKDYCEKSRNPQDLRKRQRNHQNRSCDSKEQVIWEQNSLKIRWTKPGNRFCPSYFYES